MMWFDMRVSQRSEALDLRRLLHRAISSRRANERAYLEPNSRALGILSDTYQAHASLGKGISFSLV